MDSPYIFVAHTPLFTEYRRVYSILLAVSLDFGQAHVLINAVIEQIEGLRNDEEFSHLYNNINLFCAQHEIDLTTTIKVKRSRSISTRFKNCIVLGTTGQRDVVDCEDKYKSSIFYPVIDSILIEMKDRFSHSNMEILRSVSSLCPASSTFLSVRELEPLCQLLQCDISMLNNEVQVLKQMLKQKQLKTITDLYFEIVPLKDAFSTVVSILLAALTIPVSSTTTERTFSKLKLIKTVARNSMADNRLSDLSLLAIEKDFPVDYSLIVDAFADNHKNSRMILK